MTRTRFVLLVWGDEETALREVEKRLSAKVTFAEETNRGTWMIILVAPRDAAIARLQEWFAEGGDNWPFPPGKLLYWYEPLGSTADEEGGDAG